MVKCMKLINGEEVVADVEKVGKNLKLTNPVKFMAAKQGLAMMPFMPLMAGASLEIAEDKIMVMCELDPEVITIYKGQFGGIVPATGSLPKILTK